MQNDFCNTIGLKADFILSRVGGVSAVSPIAIELVSNLRDLDAPLTKPRTECPGLARVSNGVDTPGGLTGRLRRRRVSPVVESGQRSGRKVVRAVPDAIFGTGGSAFRTASFR
jgi:hypothetical protein